MTTWVGSAHLLMESRAYKVMSSACVDKGFCRQPAMESVTTMLVHRPELNSQSAPMVDGGFTLVGVK